MAVLVALILFLSEQVLKSELPGTERFLLVGMGMACIAVIVKRQTSRVRDC